MIWIFGILDLLTALSFILLKWDVQFIPLIFAIYFVVKGLIFFMSFASWIDVLCGVIMIFAIYLGFSQFMWIPIIWIAQKGLFSLLSS